MIPDIVIYSGPLLVNLFYNRTYILPLPVCQFNVAFRLVAQRHNTNCLTNQVLQDLFSQVDTEKQNATYVLYATNVGM